MVVKELGLSFQKERIFKAIGCHRDSDVYEEVENIYNYLTRKIEPLVTPILAYSWNKESREIYVVLTLGNKVDSYIGEFFNKDDYMEGLLVDYMLDSQLFYMEEETTKILEKDANKQGLYLVKKKVPGEDLPLEDQKKILERVDKDKKLGIECTEHYMLNPIKSMSYMYELSQEKSCLGMDHNCHLCHYGRSCQWRKEKEHENI